MPTSTDWENTKALQYVLAHEYVHIRRFDSITKLVLIAALCVHWFKILARTVYPDNPPKVEYTLTELGQSIHIRARKGMKTMIVDSHQHVMLPTSMQVKKMDDAGVDKAILFTTRGGAVQRIAAAFREDHHQDPDTAAP